jgi:hypothetical protein
VHGSRCVFQELLEFVSIFLVLKEGEFISRIIVATLFDQFHFLFFIFIFLKERDSNQ